MKALDESIECRDCCEDPGRNSKKNNCDTCCSDDKGGNGCKEEGTGVQRNRLHSSRQTYLRLIESAAESQRTPASPNTVFRKEKAMYGRIRSLSLRLRQSRFGGSKDMTRPEKEMKKATLQRVEQYDKSVNL